MQSSLKKRGVSLALTQMRRALSTQRVPIVRTALKTNQPHGFHFAHKNVDAACRREIHAMTQIALKYTELASLSSYHDQPSHPFNSNIVNSKAYRSFSTKSESESTNNSSKGESKTDTTAKPETEADGEVAKTNAESSSQSSESILSKMANFTKSEFRNIAEIIEANERALRIPKRRLLDETAVPYEKLDDEDISTMEPEKRQNARRNSERAARAALWHSQGRKVPNPDEMANIPEAQDSIAADGENAELDERKDVMVVDDAKGTVWGERISSIKEKVFGTFRRSVRSINRTIDETDNEALAKIRDAKYAVQDKMEDVRETYETSQHPLVWKLRDIHDRATMGSEAALATERLTSVDPTYNEDDLKKDMEDYIIPVLVGSILKGEERVIRSMCGGQALAGLMALFQERKTRGVIPDSLILDVAHVEISPPTLVNDVPHVKVSFSCQQVNCLRNAKGEIVEGGETDIARVMYVLMLKREFDNPDSDWRAVQLYMQQVLALV